MSEIIIIILTTLASSAFFGALTSALLKYVTDTRLEQLKQSLTFDNAIKLAESQSQQSIIQAEKSHRFSHVFERTAATLEQTYAKLYQLRGLMDGFVAVACQENTDWPLLEDKERVLGTSLNEFRDYFLPRRIYIPYATADQIEGCMKAMFQLLFRYKRAAIMSKENRGSTRAMDKQDECFAEWERLPALMSALEIEFQNILGFPREALPKPTAS